MDDRLIGAPSDGPPPARGPQPPKKRTSPPPPGGSRAPREARRRASAEGSAVDRRPRPAFRFPRWLLWLTLGLLLLNILVARRCPTTADRSSVPFSFFQDQVEAGNVTKVNAQGDIVQGEFKKAAKPDATRTSRPTKKFETDAADVRRQRPASASWRREERRGQRRADRHRPLAARRHPPVLRPDDAARRPVHLPHAPRRRRRRRRADRPRPLEGQALRGRPRSARRSRTSPASTRPRRSSSRSSTSSRTRTSTAARRDDPQGRAAQRPARHRQDAARPRGRRRGRRAVLLAVSASEFIEMVVGVGASRVRDLFEQAKKAAPAIIFIDELDAIGRSRGGPGGGLGGHDEREQTLNQILTEMDGFTGSEGVIVLAATNRPEILDQALLRPGRFDRRVAVNPPDKDGRRKILEVHSRGKPLGRRGRPRRRSPPRRPGMVGADLRNLVNEAALSAARREHDEIQLGRLHELARADHPRRRAAHHDLRRTSASAPPTTSPATRVLGMLEPGADPVRKVSIVPRGRALGVTFQSPEADRYGYDERYLRGPDRRRARRPRGRGDRLRQRHDRRRVRPRAGHAHRAPDGRPLGHVGRDRPRLGPPRPDGRADVLPRHERRPVGGHARARRRRGPPDRRRVLRGGARASCARTATSSRRCRKALLEQRDARRGRRLPRRRLRPAGRPATAGDDARRHARLAASRPADVTPTDA